MHLFGLTLAAAAVSIPRISIVFRASLAVSSRRTLIETSIPAAQLSWNCADTRNY
jgi:hypothetical protein